MLYFKAHLVFLLCIKESIIKLKRIFILIYYLLVYLIEYEHYAYINNLFLYQILYIHYNDLIYQKFKY